MIMFYTSKIISRMQFLTLEVATQKAETRISCNTIATWSTYLERNADIDNCLETGLGLGLGLGLEADASPLGRSARWGTTNWNGTRNLSFVGSMYPKS